MRSERRAAQRPEGRPEQKRQGFKAYLRGTKRGQAKNSLVGYIQEKTMVAEKICTEDGQRHQSQLKRPFKPVGAR